MRIAVTGGAGFIGAHVTSALLRRGADVLVVDDLSTGSAEAVDSSAELSVLDIRDPELVDLLVGYGPETVVHLAAQTSVTASVADPGFDRSVNLDGTVAVARAAIAAGVQRLVMASTAAVYGEPESVPVPEDAPKRPENPYGHSKLDAERALVSELRHAGMDHACLRLSNVYGPGQDAAGEGGVVAVFCETALAGRPLVVYGDGLQTRDFVYVGDVADAFARAVATTTVLDGPEGPAHNVSSGVETQINDLADMVCQAIGSSVDIVHESAREGDVRRSALDPEKASSALGWRSSTPLPAGIARTVEWFERR
jgi:UDP-glucose 4-epimerase